MTQEQLQRASQAPVRDLYELGERRQIQAYPAPEEALGRAGVGPLAPRRWISLKKCLQMILAAFLCSSVLKSSLAFFLASVNCPCFPGVGVWPCSMDRALMAFAQQTQCCMGHSEEPTDEADAAAVIPSL